MANLVKISGKLAPQLEIRAEKQLCHCQNQSTNQPTTHPPNQPTNQSIVAGTVAFAPAINQISYYRQDSWNEEGSGRGCLFVRGARHASGKR